MKSHRYPNAWFNDATKQQGYTQNQQRIKPSINVVLRRNTVRVKAKRRTVRDNRLLDILCWAIKKRSAFSYSECCWISKTLYDYHFIIHFNSQYAALLNSQSVGLEEGIRTWPIIKLEKHTKI